MKKPSEHQHFMEDYVASNDTALVQEIYRRSDESARLSKSKAAEVEFHTTIRYIEKYLAKGSKILDIGAGAGAYSLYLSRKGYDVSALELSEDNIRAFKNKLTANDHIALVQGNALDLSQYEDHSFDIVLLMGPLYHLHSKNDKLRCIYEARRVCKETGVIFFGFISNDIVVLTMQQAHADYLLNGAYDKNTFKLYDFPFVFHTLPRCRELLKEAGVKILHEIATDGVSELIQDTINALDDESYQQYLKYHFYLCEKPECLGMSNHLLFIGGNDESDH